MYPKLNDGGMLNFMEDKVKQVQKDLTHYKKIKSKWSVANTTLRTCGYFTDKSISGSPQQLRYL